MQKSIIKITKILASLLADELSLKHGIFHWAMKWRNEIFLFMSGTVAISQCLVLILRNSEYWNKGSSLHETDLGWLQGWLVHCLMLARADVCYHSLCGFFRYWHSRTMQHSQSRPWDFFCKINQWNQFANEDAKKSHPQTKPTSISFFHPTFQ